MKELKYVEGDVTKPIGEGIKLICHIVNDQGLMGSGVARSLFQKWGKVRTRYIDWYENSKSGERVDFDLGSIQLVNVEPDIAVFNMVAQHMVGRDEKGYPPIRYDALINCLRDVAQFIASSYIKQSIHIPYKMGADRAGGDWDIIENIIKNELCSKDIDVTIYKLKG
jgi:O-acetyl-ADP-ribose deacetylase (regulator of RNase III)